jgi:hypothetical protein
MSEAFDLERCRVTWDAESRRCRAVLLDERDRPLLALTFEFPDGTPDPIARIRIESAAIEALRAVLGR